MPITTLQSGRVKLTIDRCVSDHESVMLGDLARQLLHLKDKDYLGYSCHIESVRPDAIWVRIESDRNSRFEVQTQAVDIAQACRLVYNYVSARCMYVPHFATVPSVSTSSSYGITVEMGPPPDKKPESEYMNVPVRYFWTGPGGEKWARLGDDWTTQTPEPVRPVDGRLLDIIHNLALSVQKSACYVDGMKPNFQDILDARKLAGEAVAQCRKLEGNDANPS